MTLSRVLIGVLCSIGGLAVGVWLMLLCLIVPAGQLLPRSIAPLVACVALAALGGWRFPRAWTAIAMICGFPALLFCVGWFYVIADEGARNFTWLALGAAAAVLATSGAGAMAWLRRSHPPVEAPADPARPEA